uniref:Uncharacterized protein n=1 Tax=Kalanchoe fedtschenkoi TaxID=63787 RepID=A0A7N0TZN8_KALFE
MRRADSTCLSLINRAFDPSFRWTVSDMPSLFFIQLYFFLITTLFLNFQMRTNGIWLQMQR